MIEIEQKGVKTRLDVPDNKTEMNYSYCKGIKEVNKKLNVPTTDRMIKEIIDKGNLSEDEIENMITTTGKVLQEGRYKVSEYIKAVEYCSYKLQDDSQADAYRKTHPGRCAGKTRGAIQGKASLYDRTQLVQRVLGIVQVPMSLLFMSERYRAVGVLADKMVNAQYDKDQIAAADKLLQHTAPPEEIKVEHSAGMGMNDMLAGVQDSLDKLADVAQARMNAKTLDAKDWIQR